MTRTAAALSLTLLLGALAGCGQSHVPGGPTPDTGSPDASPGPVDSGIGSDGGTVVLDAATSSCDGLGPAACLGNWDCVPQFDDACCPTCTPGAPCADCTNPTYFGCALLAESSCRGGHCGSAPPWACGPAAPTCETANVVDDDSCDRVGCVPAYPPGMGAPDPATATCVPIVATSCTISCRRAPPPCPSGTVAEGDGSCYTDRCIPAFVCE